MTLTGGLGGATDWLAFAAVNAPDVTAIRYVFIGAGRRHLHVDRYRTDHAGTFEFRLFLNNGYTRAATSPPVVAGGALM